MMSQKSSLLTSTMANMANKTASEQTCQHFTIESFEYKKIHISITLYKTHFPILLFSRNVLARERNFNVFLMVINNYDMHQ